MTEPRAGLISVIVPVYRNGHTIVRAVDSVLAQAGVDVEVVLVDDASPDDSVAVIEAHYGAEPRVRLFRQERNRGQSAARNRAVDEARGEWIAVLDGDDRFRPGRLARLLRAAGESGADIVADAYYMCDAKSLAPYALRGAPLRTGPLLAADIVRFNIGACKPLFRAAFLRGSGIRYLEAERHIEDMLFLMELLLAGGRFHFEREPGYDKVSEPDSVTANREGMLPHAEALYRGFLDWPAIRADAGLLQAVRDYLSWVRDALATNRLRGVLARQGPLAALRLLLREPMVLPAAVRHLLWRKRRFAVVPVSGVA